MKDTSPDIEQEMIRRFRAMTREERMERGAALMRAGWFFAELAVRRRFPDLSEVEFRRELVRYLYGDKCAKMVK